MKTKTYYFCTLKHRKTKEIQQRYVDENMAFVGKHIVLQENKHIDGENGWKIIKIDKQKRIDMRNTHNE